MSIKPISEDHPTPSRDDIGACQCMFHLHQRGEQERASIMEHARKVEREMKAGRT